MENNEEYVTTTTDEFGTTRYLNESGELHRKGHPALIEKNGSYKHYKHGLLHNENGPAVYSTKDNKEGYWIDGKPIAKYLVNIMQLKVGLLEIKEGKQYGMK